MTDSWQLYNNFAVPWKRGIILHGIHGNGKTATIKALMNLNEVDNLAYNNSILMIASANNLERLDAAIAKE